MPCNSQYMDPTQLEVNTSIVCALLEETKTGNLPTYYGNGNSHVAYNCSSEQRLDNITAELCSRLQNLNVKDFSLEMQMWWRDHQEADTKRLKRKIQECKDRDAAISKLTPYERRLLGITE